MHKIALTLALIASIAGCAHRPIATATDFDGAYPEPLSVRLLAPDHGRLRFLTSEPAYVAIFEIVPGSGVSMVYPSPGEYLAPVSSAGYNTAFVPLNAEGRWYYADAQFYSAMSTVSRPKYLYIIASRVPLSIDHIRRSPRSLRHVLGWNSFLATDLSGTLDDIERLVAGSIPEDEWSSDVYVIWPEMRSNRSWRTLYMFMQCGDGRAVLVPVEWNIHACPGTRRLAEATKPPTPPTSKPRQPPGSIPDSDTTEVQPPPNIRGGPRPPQPAPPLIRNPGDAAIRRPGHSERIDRGGPPAGAARPIERQPAPAPAPRPDAPRPSPLPRAEVPRSEPPRSEPGPSAPTPSEPAERKPAEKP